MFILYYFNFNINIIYFLDNLIRNLIFSKFDNYIMHDLYSFLTDKPNLRWEKKYLKDKPKSVLGIFFLINEKYKNLKIYN